MAPVTVAFGILFIVLGIVGYLPHQALTALIPAAFGFVFIVLGVLAYQDRLRKHVMHLAAMLGLLGCIGSAVMVVRSLLAGIPRPLALTMNALMAGSCAVFVALCVKSFIDARMRRRQQEKVEST